VNLANKGMLNIFWLNILVYYVLILSCQLNILNMTFTSGYIEIKLFNQTIKTKGKMKWEDFDNIGKDLLSKFK